MLTLLCGKMAAGKSTKAAELVASRAAVLFSEDEWLSRLYPGQVNNIEDYVKYSNLI
jgi:predicted kinase